MGFKKYTLALVALAISTGAMATMAVKEFLERPRDIPYPHVADSQNIETRELLVVTEDLPPGAEITKGVIMAMEFPDAGLHRDVLDPDNFANILGTIVKSPVTANAPLLKSQLDFSRYTGLASLIGKDERVITVPVNPLSSMSYLLKPENRVDVLYTDHKHGKTVSLLTNMRVLATGQTSAFTYSTDAAQTYGTVSLACDATACQKIAHALTIGELAFVLSHQKNAVELEYSSGTTRDDLLGIEKNPARVVTHRQKIIVQDGAGKILARH